MSNEIRTLHNLKVAVAFTLPPYYAIITEKVKGFEDFSYVILEWKSSQSLVYCTKARENELDELAWRETYFLGRIFIPENNERDLDDNTLIVSQLHTFTAKTKEEKYKWESLWKYVLNTFISEDIIFRKYKEWFKLDPKSLFVKLYELSLNPNPMEFISLYYSHIRKADIIISISDFLRLDQGFPIDLSFYLSPLSSPTSYANYWIIYAPLRFKSYIKCNLLPVLHNFIKIVKENRLEKAEFRIYMQEGSIDRKMIHFEILNRLRNRQSYAPFIENDYFEIIVSQQFFKEFKREVEVMKINNEYENILVEKLKEFGIKERRIPIADHILPVRIVNVKPHRESLEFLDWTIFGRRVKFIHPYYYTQEDIIELSKNITFYKHPIYSNTPVIFDTSILHKGVHEDKYFIKFIEYFVQEKDVIIPSVVLYELFTNLKWKESPPMFLREMQERLFVKNLKVEAIEPVSILTLLLALSEKKKKQKVIKEKSRSIRDVSTLLATVNNKGVLITADKNLHKFASTIGIPALRYVRRDFFIKFLKDKGLSEQEIEKIMDKIDKWINQK